MTPPTPASAPQPGTRKRALLLVTLVAAGWLFVADPSRCEGPDRTND
ncbi:MAG: hypothetical protein IH627_24135 [Rubrivivax sp.]|nr:hypothetical protein [Rubrivivax sp.]